MSKPYGIKKMQALINEKQDNSFCIQWHLTSKCQGNCTFCYMKDSSSYQKELKNELSKEQCLEIVRKYASFLKKKKLSGTVLLTGGDPSIKEGFWEILEELQKNNITAIILGNPHFINDKTAEKLHKLGVRHYQLSIDGMEETHNYFRGEGSFNRTWKAAAILRKHGVSVGISYTLSALNCSEIEGVLKLCSIYKISTFRPSRLVPEGRGEDFKDKLISPSQFQSTIYKIFKHFSESKNKTGFPISLPVCDPLFRLPGRENPNLVPPKIKMGVEMEKGCKSKLLTILPDGTLYSCRRLPIAIGNITKDSFEKATLSKLVTKLADPGSFKECTSCKHFKLCKGGCPSVTYAIKGTPFAKDPQCWVNLNNEER